MKLGEKCPSLGSYSGRVQRFRSLKRVAYPEPRSRSDATSVRWLAIAAPPERLPRFGFPPPVIPRGYSRVRQGVIACPGSYAGLLHRAQRAKGYSGRSTGDVFTRVHLGCVDSLEESIGERFFQRIEGRVVVQKPRVPNTLSRVWISLLQVKTASVGIAFDRRWCDGRGLLSTCVQDSFPGGADGQHQKREQTHKPCANQHPLPLSPPIVMQ